MQTLTQLQSFARELMRFDWNHAMSDDGRVSREGMLQQNKFILTAATLGKDGQRLYDLAESYFTNNTGESTGSEWRFIGAVLWIYGIVESENKLKSYVTENGLIKFGALRIAYPSHIFQTW